MPRRAPLRYLAWTGTILVTATAVTAFAGSAAAERLAAWCYTSPALAILRDTRFGMPVTQSVHLVGITTLLGTTLVLNLRLLQLGFTAIALPDLTAELWPWTKRGLVLTLASGVCVFIVDPSRYAASIPFRVKMVLLCLAVLFHVTVFKDAIGWGDQDRPRVRTAAIALVSLTLWFGVGWAGRGIAFF